MGIRTFLEDLFDTGHVRVAADAPLSDDLREADAALRAAEEIVRLDLPGDPPPFDVAAARWAACVMYRACQVLADRPAGLAPLDAAIRRPAPDAANPAAHYSVDLTLRYLPDLIGLAGRTGDEDSFVARLRDLAAEWPLSGVGVDGIDVRNLGAITGDPSLLQLYADRVIARRDRSRLADERARDAVRRSLGLFPELAPDLAGALDSIPVETAATP